MGKCNNCFQKLQVLTQVGAERFGMNAGYCLPCITYLIPEEPTLEVEVGFSESDDLHIIRIDCEKIENFLKNPKFQESLSEEERSKLNEAIEKNKGNPNLAKAKLYKSKPNQCKTCLGYVLNDRTFSSFTTMRDKSNYLICCFGCGIFIGRDGGCSILTCPDKVCRLQTCAYCLNGATTLTNFSHDINVCSNRIYNKKSVPQPRQCECNKVNRA
jgi:hypothetical protein